MTATDELRRLLDERDVKYQKLNEYITWVFLEDRAITFFSDEFGVSAEVSYPRPVLNGTKFLTPEQAIAATLGDEDYERKMDALLCRLTNGKFSKSRAYDLDFMESCVNEEFEMLYADELNATLRGEGERE